MKKIVRTASGLRNALFDQLDALNNKTVVANDARAFSALAGNIIKSVEVQMRYEAMRADGLQPALSDMPLVVHEEQS